MSATLTDTTATLTAPKPVLSLRTPELIDHSPVAIAEEHRWLLALGIPFVVAAACFAAAIGTGWIWLMGPTLVLGPMLIIIGFIYLSLSSDANGTE